MRYGNVELHNVCDIIEGDGAPGIGVSRLPLDVLPNINPGARNKAVMSANCEIRGMLPEGGKASVVLQCPDTDIIPPVAAVFHGDFFDRADYIGPEERRIEITSPPRQDLMSKVINERGAIFDSSLVRVRLPHINGCRIISVEGDLAYPEEDATPSTAMLCYGSSITHGAHGIAPGSTYVSQCARNLGCDLINLGFGGSAHMDAAIAEHIASRDDWHFATFEMGINVRSWPLEDFEAAVERFVSTIAEANPDKWLFCIDLFTNNCDFGDTPPVGVGFREAVGAIVANQNSAKVVHVDGRGIITDPTGMRIDLVHPSDDGMYEMGRNLADVISRSM